MRNKKVFLFLLVNIFILIVILISGIYIPESLEVLKIMFWPFFLTYLLANYLIFGLPKKEKDVSYLGSIIWNMMGFLSPKSWVGVNMTIRKNDVQPSWRTVLNTVGWIMLFYWICGLFLFIAPFGSLINNIAIFSAVGSLPIIILGLAFYGYLSDKNNQEKPKAKN